MVTISFHPGGCRVTVKRGTTILEAARRAGMLIESPCNGAETCSKCRVQLDAGSLRHIVRRGHHHLEDREEGAGNVLACGAEVVGDIVVHLPAKASERSLKITGHGRKAEVSLDPNLVKKYSAEEGVTSVYAGGELVGVEEGDTARELYGVVVDIGTTTLVVALVSLTDGQEQAIATALNPQSLLAQDVLSRIHLSASTNGLEELRHGLIGEIDRLIGITAAQARIGRELIYEAVFSGNTCMLHLAAGVSPASLGRFPYTPSITGGEWREAAALGLTISPLGVVYLPPVISGYVGADITSGILATRLHEERGTVLFVDIGTNGEMAIVRDGKLWATSTAAGPAFEGMNITFGMRAGDGAIERFIVAGDGEVMITTVGGDIATGICGSGLLDIIGELVKSGIIGANGRFVTPESQAIPTTLKERLVRRDGKTVFLLTDNVWLTQKDVRQVQLAKGAIRAGIDILLRATGTVASEVEKVLIAGSFGYHLRAESLIAIGLLPPDFAGRIEFVGNTSKAGGEAFLLNRDSRCEMKRLASDVEVVELANFPDFDKVFVAAIQF